MEIKFKETIEYMRKLKQIISDDNSDLTDEEILLLIIQDAILSSEYKEGAILFTKEQETFKISNIQKHSYGRILQGKKINLNYIISKLNELGVDSKLISYPIGNNKNDYELSFQIIMTNPKIKTKK